MDIKYINYAERLSWNIEKRKRRRDFLKIWFSNLCFLTSIFLLIYMQVEDLNLDLLAGAILFWIINTLLCVGCILLRKWWKGDC